MSRPITKVVVIIESGGDVPTQVVTDSIHDTNTVRNKFKNAKIDWWSDKPAIVEIEAGDENETVLMFPVETIKMISTQKIPVKPMIEIAQAPAPKLM